ncbi:MAG TPA: hypothetical protein V6C69_01225 [Trichormus sp.]
MRDCRAVREKKHSQRAALVETTIAFASMLLTLAPAFAQSSAQQMALAEQDDRMFRQMRQVAGWIDQYCLWNHRWPEVGEETDEAQQQLNQLVPNNPYVGGFLTIGGGPEDTNPDASLDDMPAPSDAAAGMNRVQVSIDSSLTEESVREDMKDTPVDWTSSPGTITVIGNQQNMYCLWGAGRDGKPLKDPLSGRTQIIVGHYSMLNNGE